ncbi:uncharacterized protein LOC110863234 isoform X1 [Folsomia candida]|uniref:uncharacterized protein LOC110863234 isoform X1 n=2 Tax=Folsomia candida TaxID=158441 RepID=UPI001605148F|nr:uncharacterized protein LOC110863234 isoform X1 [Folsomia candida]
MGIMVQKIGDSFPFNKQIFLHPPKLLPFQSSAFLFYKAFSQFCYYTLITPSCAVVVGGSVSIKSNKLQKVCCFILHAYMTYNLISSNFRKLLKVENITENPLALYEIVTETAPKFTILTFLYISWTRKMGLDYLYRSCFKAASHSGHSIATYSKLFVLFLIFILVTIGGQLSGLVKNDFNIVKQWQFSHEPVIFLRNIVSDVPIFRDVVNMGISPVLIIFLSFYDNLFRFISTIHLPMLTCYIIKMIGDEMCDYLDNNDSMDCEMFIKMYDQVYQLISDINGVVKHLMQFWIINVLTFFSQTLATIFNPKLGALDRIYSAVIFTVFLTFLRFAALASYRLDSVHDFIFRKKQDRGYCENKKLHLMMANMQQNPLGLKASDFRISFGFIVTIFSTAVTYFIILLQFSTGKSHNTQQ